MLYLSNAPLSDQGIPRDPRFVFCAFKYFRLRFFDRYFFLIVYFTETPLLTQNK